MSDKMDRANRSVNDFHSGEDLHRALTSMDTKRSTSSDGTYVSFMYPTLQDTQIGAISSHKEEKGECSHAEGSDEPNKQLDWVLENYDEETTVPQSLNDELRRLSVLKSYHILDDERKESFEHITGLASRMFKCPMALISLVDLGRQWFMSNRGLNVRETKRKYAFCAHAIMGKADLLIVHDATKDVRFQTNPLVTGPPHIKFYAGAPLTSPEGYKLGTLCVLDREPRPEGMTQVDKQNLMELAALAVQAMVDHKQAKVDDRNDPQELLAYTAHDLLTPLTGVQLSLSLLMEDEDFRSTLSPEQRRMVSTASNCTDVMGRICQTAIDSFRRNQKNDGPKAKKSKITKVNNPMSSSSDSKGPVAFLVSDLVTNLHVVLDPLPKKVPLIITVHPSVPGAIVADDLKVFLAALNYLINACEKTEAGSIHLQISTEVEAAGRKLVFKCEDTGPGVPEEKWPHLFKPYRGENEDNEEQDNCLVSSADEGFQQGSTLQMPKSGLGLYSVAMHIGSIGGEYGFRPRKVETEKTPHGKPVTGSIFWFKIALVEPDGERFNSSILNTKKSGKELSEEFASGKMVNVLRTPSLAEVGDKKVGTKIREGEARAGIQDTAVTVQTTSTLEMVGSETKVADEGRDTKDVLLKKAVSIKEFGTRQKRALVIEDSVVVRKSLSRVLTKLGFEAVQAVDGMEGLNELQSSLFDVVLCDFLMPVMDGLDCVHQYREWETLNRPFFRQYIIGISAHANEKDILKGIEVGMDDFKPKPVTYKQLADLHKSKELEAISDRLDEIYAAGTMMVDENGETADNGADLEKKKSSNTSEVDNKRKLVEATSSNTSIHFALIAVEKETAETKMVQKAAKDKGWKSVIVHNGEEALRLMKTRNWDIICLDEELPVLGCSQCVAKFREWEEKNRVNRQRNFVLLSTTCVTMERGSKSMVQLPFGFDYSLGKPIRTNEFEYIMSQAERSETDFGVRDIVSR